MSTYRFTRPELYRNDCPGRDDVGARQGHYVEADSAQEARQKLQQDFPGETLEQDQREGLGWTCDH